MNAVLVGNCECCSGLTCSISTMEYVDVYFMYYIQGLDHSGYCSDAEGEEIRPYTLGVKKSIPKDDYDFFLVLESFGNKGCTRKYLSIYDHEYDQCTSDGSGYCDNCCIKAILVDIVKK